MARFEFLTLDVFTDRRFGGNPLAVFPDANGMDADTMQALARELNMSEVAFVLDPADRANTARVRIFTPLLEIGFAGHPNVGVAWVLADRRNARERSLRFEEGAGLVEVEIDRDAAGAVRACRVAAPRPLRLGEPPTQAELAACASLAPDELGPAMLASVALDTVCVPVAPAALARARCDVDAFRAVAARRPDLAEIFLLCLYARDGDRMRMRVFAPLSGTIEDPATGSAAAALAAGLLANGAEARLALEVVQGVEMGRPSLILAEAWRAADGSVRASVGGGCVPLLRGEALL